MKAEEACADLRAEELLMERKIQGNIFKLWKRIEAKCLGGSERKEEEAR